MLCKEANNQLVPHYVKIKGSLFPSQRVWNYRSLSNFLKWSSGTWRWSSKVSFVYCTILQLKGHP